MKSPKATSESIATKCGLPTATAFAALAGLVLSSPALRAASDTWAGTTDPTWATTTNWVGGNVPGAGDTATFNGAGNGNTTIDLGAGVTLGTLLFDTSSAAAYTIGSGAVGSQTLTFGTLAGGVQMNSTVANNELIDSNLALSTSGTYSIGLTNNSTTNTLSVAGGISTSTTGAKLLTVTGAGNTAISGNLTNGTGTLGLIKTGAGTLSLSGTNLMNENLTIGAGRINVTAGSTSAGAKAAGFNNIGNVASSTGVVNVSNGATLSFAATTNSGGNGTGGNLGTAANASGVIYNSGTFTAPGGVTQGSGIYIGNANNAYGYLYNAGTTSITGRIWVSQSDGGTLTNGAVGVLDIASGTVTATGTNQAAAFQLNAPNKTYTTTAGFGGVNVTGGTLALTPSQTYQINTGVRLYSSVNVFGASGKITTGATGGFNLNNTSNALNSTTFTIGNGGEVDTSFISNTGSALSTGILAFNNGTIKATAADATALIRSGVTTYIQAGGATIDTNGFNTTVATPLQAPSGNGVTSITLGGTATGYVGAPVVQITGDGTGAAAIANFDPTTGTVTGITVTSPGTGYTTAPTVTLVGGNGGSTGAGVGTATGTAAIGAVTSGGFTKTGAGTLTLSAANTYTGATTISQGTLALANTGSLASTTFNIGAGAILDVSAQGSGFSLTGKAITLTLDAVNPGSINAAGQALTLGGTLALDFTTGTPGASYVLYTAGSLSGDFGSIALGGNFSGSLTETSGVWNGSSNGYNFSLDQSTGTLSVTAVPEPSVIALVTIGLGGGLMLRRRRSKA